MRQDIATKRLEEYPEVFVDIINVTLFDGEEILKPENLTQIPTEAFSRGVDGELRQGNRDVLMADMKNGRYCLICGEENQKNRDNTMPQRVMGYDFAIYEKQIRDHMRDNDRAGNPAITKRIHDDQRLAPVVTVILYWGDEEWTHPRDLYDMLCFPPEWECKIKPLVANYPLNLIDMKRLPAEVRSKFTSDFRVVAEYMAHKDDVKTVEHYIQKDRTPIRHPGAFLDFLGTLTSKKKYEQIKGAILQKQERGEEITMFCIEDEWERRGIERGIQQFGSLVTVLLEEGKYEELKRVSMDTRYCHQLCEQYGIAVETVN